MLSTINNSSSNAKFNTYFYQSNTLTLKNGDLTKQSTFSIVNTDYVNVNIKNYYPMFNFNKFTYGVNNSIGIINSFYNTHNSVGLYYSPTGQPLKKIQDKTAKNNIGTFSLYNGNDLTNGNYPTAVAVNNFDKSFSKISFASYNEIASGNYNSNTVLSNSPINFNITNHSFVITPSEIGFITIGSVVIVAFVGIVVTIIISTIIKKMGGCLIPGPNTVTDIVDDATNAPLSVTRGPIVLANDSAIAEQEDVAMQEFVNEIRNLFTSGEIPNPEIANRINHVLPSLLGHPQGNYLSQEDKAIIQFFKTDEGGEVLDRVAQKARTAKILYNHVEDSSSDPEISLYRTVGRNILKEEVVSEYNKYDNIDIFDTLNSGDIVNEENNVGLSPSTSLAADVNPVVDEEEQQMDSILAEFARISRGVAQDVAVDVMDPLDL